MSLKPAPVYQLILPHTSPAKQPEIRYNTVRMTALPVYSIDPTIADQASAVRGLGRYLQLLHEHLGETITWVDDSSQIPYDSIFLDPFFHLRANPWKQQRYARVQIAIIHDLIPQQYRSHFPIGIKGAIIEQINRWNLKNIDHIVTVSKKVKDDVVDVLGYDSNNVTSIYSTWSKNIITTSQSKNVQLPDEPFFLYVGDVTWNKNLPTLAQAVRKGPYPCLFVGKQFETSLPTDVPDHPWLTPFREFLSLADESSTIRLIGYLPDDLLQQYYQKATANVLVSHAEGFGLSYLEAARNGTPSVLSDIPVLREIAADSAVFVNQNDPDAIAQALTHMAAEEDRQRFTSLLETNLERFTPEQFQHEYRSLFAQLGTTK